MADLAEAGGWEAEYPRDVWCLRRLGFDGGRILRFDGIPQTWLRELAKRWTRWRISSGLGLEAATRPVRAITRFARFLAAVGVERVTGIDRAVLEHYLADLHAEMAGTQRHGDHIGQLNAFFAAIPLRLPADCVVTDTDGAPYLCYFNHKMKRESLVPIDEELRDLLGHQRQRNTQRWPTGTPGLFPRPTKNIEGHQPITSSTYRLALHRWLEGCDVRDEHGSTVHLPPHQWRHTLGTWLRDTTIRRH